MAISKAQSVRQQEPVRSYNEQKQELQKKNSSVVRPIPRIDNDILPSKKGGGRKKKYSPTKMRNEINKYFEKCEQDDTIPSIKGLMIHLKMYKDLFYKYLTYPGYSDLMEHTRLVIQNWIEEDIYNTKGLAAGKLKYVQNLHGWTDKIESHNTTEQRIVSVDEARAKIEMLAPKLLELLKNTVVMEQIGTSHQIGGKGAVVEGEVLNVSA